MRGAVASVGASLLALPATLRSALLLAGVYNWKTSCVGGNEINKNATLTTPVTMPAQATSAATYATMAPTTDAASAQEQAAMNRGQRAMLARRRSQEDPESHSARTQATSSGYFPLSYKDGLSQWWASLAPAVTEHRVLSFVPYLQRPPTHTHAGSAPASAKGSTFGVDNDSTKDSEPVRTSSFNDAFGPRQWNSELVQLAGKNRFLNEFSVERLGERDPKHALVMLHGYGAGLGFFYKNFEALSRLPDWKLYALDMLGMGRSSRPPFRIHARDRQAKIREAENWFIDALEEWRVKRGIEKMTLLGHSLGGYMAVCYALKYPGHLNKLILASPVGIPEDPYAMNDEIQEPSESTMANEFTQSQDETTESSRPQVEQHGSLNPKEMAERTRNGNGSAKPPRRQLPKWLTTLWDANISPFSLVRLSGPLGPRLVSGWTSRRFSHLPAEEAQALHDYSYSLFRQRGSGEYALAYVLAPGAFARSPLIRRIQGVGHQYIGAHSTPDPDPTTNGSASSSACKVRESGIPVVLMYGEHDWMDVAGGFAAEQKLHDARAQFLAQASEEEKKRENGDAKVTIIRKAGHHVYLDGWEEFNQCVLNEMRDVEVREKRLKEAGCA
jgi:cardiolipin-specific phospholipase